MGLVRCGAYGACVHHHPDCSVDWAFWYLLLIPPKSTSGEGNTGTATAIVILRVNVMTFFVTQWFGLGCGMKSPLLVCVMRSMRIDVGVTFTMRPYSRTPLLMNEQICPMYSLACLEFVMRISVVVVVVAIIVLLCLLLVCNLISIWIHFDFSIYIFYSI